MVCFLEICIVTHKLLCMKLYFTVPIIISFIFSCKGQQTQPQQESASVEITTNILKDSVKITDFYSKNKENNQSSISKGTVSNGHLENGKLIPYFGKNFRYFDTESYLSSRAYTNNEVYSIIIDSYKELEAEEPNRFFYLMELSNKEGGKIFPHRTHQNGLSVDFMIPKIKDNKPFYGLDTLGKDHYFLNFNNNGEYDQDTTIKADFNLIAKHIIILNKQAKNHGYKISKVILKLEYKDKLFSTEYGKLLEKSGIYFAKNLTPLINNLHDDHYHIDFEKL